jgi:DNA-directed RNA polymerase subunit RPC12/RpoP
MRFYKCSKCGKEVLPKGVKEMIIKAYGKVFYRKTYAKKYCNCEQPDITESIKEFDRENKIIAEAIKEVVNSRCC